MTPETIEMFKRHPAWRAFVSMAPSCYYDAIISRDHSSLPLAELSRITAPSLVLCGGDSPQYLHDVCREIAERVSGAEFRALPGQGHLFDQKVGAPLLLEFFQ
jgi:pimeloyl-ACP methyl ester carboxylesterase